MHQMDIPVAALRFDHDSHRWRDRADRPGDDDNDILSWLHRVTRLTHLMESIAEWGFAPGSVESLDVATEEGTDSYIVLDGAQRLGAVMLLTSVERREAFSDDPRPAPARWASLADMARAHNLSTLPVVVHEARADVDAWFALRHDRSFRRLQRSENDVASKTLALLRSGADADEVARVVHIRPRQVVRLAEIGAVLEVLPEALGERLYVHLSESVIAAALDHDGVRALIGLDPAGQDTTVAKVLHLDTDTLKELCVALNAAGSDVTRWLDEFAAVYQHPDARRDLIDTRDLDRALWHVDGDEDRLCQHLWAANIALLRAGREARAFDADSRAREVAERVRNSAIDVEKRLLSDEERALYARLIEQPADLDPRHLVVDRRAT